MKAAAGSLAGGVVWILAIAFVVGLVHRDVPITAEILSRTKPDLFNLIIAFAGGAAGAIAVLSPRVGTAIVGVAVATALVPPPAAAGLLAARADFTLARGAFLLALTNIAAIQVAFSAVFWIGGYRQITTIDQPGFFAFLRKDFLGVGFIVILAIVLGIQLHNAIKTSLFESGVRAALRQCFDNSSGFHLVDVRLARQGASTVVTAIIRGLRAPPANKVASAQAALPLSPDGSSLSLRVRFVETVIVTPQGRGIDSDAEEQ